MIGCIVIAAGYGSLREQGGRPVPKVVEHVGGVPMIGCVLRAAEHAGIATITVVVNPRDQDRVMNTIMQARHIGAIHHIPSIVLQPERRGSADALLHALPNMAAAGAPHALVMYGDMPNWSARTLRRLIRRHRADSVVTMTTVLRGADRPILDRYGRVVRDEAGHISRIVEPADTKITDEILAIERVNPSLWIWNLEWLKRSIPKIRPTKRYDGYPDELHMPPLIEMATSQARVVGELPLATYESVEALGVNTLDELQALNMSLKR